MVWKKHQLNVIQKHCKYCTTLFVNKPQQVESLDWRSHSGKLVTSEKTGGEIMWVSDSFLSMNGAFFSLQLLSSSPELNVFPSAIVCALFTFPGCFYSLLSSSSSLFAPFSHHKATWPPYYHLLPLLLFPVMPLVGVWAWPLLKDRGLTRTSHPRILYKQWGDRHSQSMGQSILRDGSTQTLRLKANPIRSSYGSTTSHSTTS